jgi:iron-sulfur cluster assembly protein
MENINPSDLNFSEKEINHFLSSLESRGTGAGIQMGVKKAGCSGNEYFFDFEDRIDAKNIVFEKMDAKFM